MNFSDTTVIIPVKDEPATEKVAKSVLKELPNCRVIIIYKGKPYYKGVNTQITVVQQVGSGKGVAVRQAARLVKTPIFCLIDGDATYEPKDLRKLVQLVRDGADMAIGNRFDMMDEGAMPEYVKFGNNVLTVTSNVLYSMHIKDSQTGIRAMKKKVFDSLETREINFGIETEMTVMAKKRNFKVVEIPAHYYKRIGEEKHMKVSGGFKLLAIGFRFLFRD